MFSKLSRSICTSLMWVIELHHNYEWVNDNAKTMTPRLSLPINFKSEPELDGKLLIYGTDYEFTHASIQLNVDSKDQVEKFCGDRLHKIVNSLELTLSIAHQQPFHFRKVPGSNDTLVSYGEVIDGQNQPVNIATNLRQPILDYELIKQALGHRFIGLEDYELFFMRGIDTTLDHDYRWLNLYKIFERRFNTGGKAKLIKNNDWIKFLEQHGQELTPFLSSGQSLQGLMEELRASAAHTIAGLETRQANKRLRETLDIVIAMAKRVLNEHPDNNTGLIFT